ncbi:receptor-like protein 14 [Vicia villosa]|uniref:receptor-like protein 14 n=1 Tax=Vicia villosa TaxID=3911 RepID=UPI00273AC24D|nr:receptor-like protein 14 [Vicia villosa]
MKLGFMISCLFYLVSLMWIQNEVSCKGCLENERIGLLDIKHFMVSHKDDYSTSYIDDELVSWVDDRNSNCCAWNRVTCSNISTGHITELNLGWSQIQFSEFPVMLNVSLLHPFEEIRLLDLSRNGFGGFIGKEGFPQLKNLKALDLSYNRLNGSILSSLNGLTALTTLSLSDNLIGHNLSAQDKKNKEGIYC